MLKFGVAGMRGLVYLPWIRKTGLADVTALCDLNAGLLESQADRYGIPGRYRFYSEMIDEADIDVVLISTPMQFHADQVISALQSGRHVMCEVTLGTSMDEMFWIFEEAGKAKGKFFFIENYCYLPAVQHMLSIIRSGLLGELYYAESGYIHNTANLLTYNYGLQTSGKPSWRRYWQMGKPGAYYPTHSVGPLMQMFGKDERIAEIRTVGTGHWGGECYRQDNSCTTLIQLDSGKLIDLRIDSLSKRPLCITSYRVQGTKGCIELGSSPLDSDRIWHEGLEPVDSSTWRRLSDFDGYMPERYRSRDEEVLQGWRGGGDYFMIADYIHAIVNDEEPPIGIREACEWTSVGLLSELSVTNNGRIMKMPDFRRPLSVKDQRIVLD